MIVEELARQDGERFRKVRFLPAESAEIRVGEERVILARSTRYMNESGPSYASLAKKQGIEPAHVVAVHDELDIPAGDDPDQAGRGDSGHNGLRSLDQALRTPEYLRVRVGSAVRRERRTRRTSCSSRSPLGRRRSSPCSCATPRMPSAR